MEEELDSWSPLLSTALRAGKVHPSDNWNQPNDRTHKLSYIVSTGIR